MAAFDSTAFASSTFDTGAGAAAITCTLAWAEQSEAVSAAATTSVAAAAAWVEASDTAAVVANVGVSGVVAWSEQAESAVAALSAQATAGAGWSEQGETTVIAGSIGNVVAASAAWSESGEIMVTLATVRIDASAGWAEQSDTSGFSVQVLASAGLSWTESPEGVAIAGDVGQAPTAAAYWSEAAEVFAAHVTSQAQTFARAPSGPGYTPQRNEYQARPAQIGGSRPPATQDNSR